MTVSTCFYLFYVPGMILFSLYLSTYSHAYIYVRPTFLEFWNCSHTHKCQLSIMFVYIIDIYTVEKGKTVDKTTKLFCQIALSPVIE